jgi:hypothetical protein
MVSLPIVLVSKRKTSSASATFDTYAWNDGLGRKYKQSDAENVNNQIVVDTFYDTNGEVKKNLAHLASMSATYTAPATGISNTEMTYDPLNRLTIVKNVKGDTKTISYDHGNKPRLMKTGISNGNIAMRDRLQS